MKVILASAAAVAIVTAVGCGPRIVATTTGGAGTACVGDRCARLAAPGAGWASLPSSVTRAREGASIGWQNPVLDAVILAHVSCQADRLQLEAAPLASLTRILLLGTTERRTLLDETVPFSGREARHMIVAAKLDGVPRLYDLWVARKNDCLLDLSYVTPPDRHAAGQAAFQRVVDSAASEATLARGAP
jgi:hypothetical protein